VHKSSKKSEQHGACRKKIRIKAANAVYMFFVYAVAL
jgi:hypothetical protein